MPIIDKSWWPMIEKLGHARIYRYIFAKQGKYNGQIAYCPFTLDISATRILIYKKSSTGIDSYQCMPNSTLKRDWLFNT